LQKFDCTLHFATLAKTQNASSNASSSSSSGRRLLLELESGVLD
jgi:hypothetical protein